MQEQTKRKPKAKKIRQDTLNLFLLPAHNPADVAVFIL